MKKWKRVLSLILIIALLFNDFQPLIVLASEVIDDVSNVANLDGFDISSGDDADETVIEEESSESLKSENFEENNSVGQEDSEEFNSLEQQEQENFSLEQEQENNDSSNILNNTFVKSNNDVLKKPVYGSSTINSNSATKIIQMTDTVDIKGNIEVELHLVLPVRNCGKDNILFKIYDENNNVASVNLSDIYSVADGYYEKNIALGEQKNIRVVSTKRDKDGTPLSGVDITSNIVYFSINLYSLNKGNYTIEFSGEHFVKYRTSVKLDDFSKRVSVTNEKGMFEIGDVNNDGVVDDKDSNLMIEAIDNKDLSLDLNLDGEIDIADLNYITAIVNDVKKTRGIEDTSAIVDGKNISFEVDENSLAEGSSQISSIFSDEGVVRLQSSNGEKVSEDNPINLTIDLSGKNNGEAVKMREIRIASGDNVPEKLKVLVEMADGSSKIFNPKEVGNGEFYEFTEKVTDDTFVIDLGSKVAVKKVTIIITEVDSNNLADIAKVEFLNNVKVQAKEPDNFYTPKNIEVVAGSEQLTVNFENVPNVTGYEIKIIGPKMEKGTIFQTTYNTFTIEDLKNYATYDIYVQSVNQEWRSGFNKEAVKGTPIATRKPPAPDMVVATATYAGIDFSWKDMDDTKSYNLYYREVGTDEWLVIREITRTSYSLKGLKSSVNYEAYITGNNDLGEGVKSQTVKAKTLEAGAAIVPQYYLINDSYNQDTKRTVHIENVQFSTGTMTDGNKFSMVDDNYGTYWSLNDWQISASNNYNTGTPVIVLDNAYKMDEFVLTVPDSYAANLKPGGINSSDVKVHYWENEHDVYNNTDRNEVKGTLVAKYDENNRKYYTLKLSEPIVAKAVAFGLTVANNVRDIKIDEVKFYKYDSLVDDVAALFTDDLRLVLADGVDMDDINALRQRAETKDHDEYSPYKSSVLADLDYAEKILKDEKINDVITLNPNISNSYNGHLGFAMNISDYQPLGIVARPGDTLNVYVGSTGNVNVELVYTQFYAEANTWSKTSQKLTKGQNVVNIEKIGSAEAERGGSVYIRYTSKPDVNNPIKVRVSGGNKIPMLDVSMLTDDALKKDAIKNYVQELSDYNSSLEEVYSKDGKVFDRNTSVLGATEIVTKYGLLSVSSVAVNNALNTNVNSIDEKVNRLYESTEAFDEMMELFYRHKGLSLNAADSKDEMPKARVNVRYMRMFDGAFMYAGGYHIGIEYGSIAGLVQAHRNTNDATGYFGWGISHEVGHQINQGNTVYAEVTNNVYSLLAQTSNDKDTSRLEGSKVYEKIYDKVTSHTSGRSQNVFVQLGMYWQLHLAYDDNKTFEDVNSIYARINHLSRTYVNSKKYSKDDLTILFASMAANRNLIDYFTTWGLDASDDVKAEIEALNLEKETRAIYYLNDAARRYRLNTNVAMSKDTKVSANIVESDNKNKRVTLNFKVNLDSDKILGYEILRNGESISFVEGDINTFTDNIGAENNRAYTYEVIAYDYLLNKTESAVLDEVKIMHNGSVVKNTFTIESNVKDKNEIVNYEDEDMDFSKLSVNNLIDGKSSTYFNGTEKVKTLTHNGNSVNTSVDDGNAYVIISLNGKMSVSGIQYKAALEDGKLLENTINKYKIYVKSSDKDKWTEVKSGTFNLTSENNYTDLVYFMKEGTTSKSQLWTYNDVSYIKIESVDNKNGLSGDEFDIIAPPGDNIDITMSDNNVPTIGKLEKDYCYLTDGCKEVDQNGNKIGIVEKGSVIIKGSYRGNPSFNVVGIGDYKNVKKLYDGYQLIFAELNDDKTVYDVADGTWIYVMTKEQYEKMIASSSSIRAYLYRVNDSTTMEGQRLTSTSVKVDNLVDYDNLSSIVITSSDIGE